jgi:hypothetical protein
MTSRRVSAQLALVPLLALLMLAPATGARQQPSPGPPRTGVLVMVVGNPEGVVVYAKPMDAVYRSALQVAGAQGDIVEAAADAGTLKAAVGTAGANGGKVTLSIAVSKMSDGRVEVRVSPAGEADYPTAATATRFYVAALTAAVSGKPVRVRACVFSDETQQLNVRGRREAVKDLTDELRALPVDVVPTGAKETAKVWLDVLRISDGEGLTVRLTVPGTDYSTEWTRSSPRDAGTAEELVEVFKGWLDANRDFLLTRQDTRPIPAGRCGPPESGAAPASTSASSEKVRLYLGPAPAAHGFVDVDPAFAASYTDLCLAYNKTPSFNSALTLVSKRDAADLILELNYRNEPIHSHDALEEVRATLFVVGPGTRVALNGRTGISKVGDSRESSWPMQATRLLQQTLDWVNSNRAVIDQAKASRVSKLPER